MNVEALLLRLAQGKDSRLSDKILSWFLRQPELRRFLETRDNAAETRAMLVAKVSDLWDIPNSSFSVEECNAAIEVFMPEGLHVETHCPFCLVPRSIGHGEHVCSVITQKSG